MLVLDGSYGEGGGQIIRTALSLAALTGTTVTLEHIRAGRPKPGLRPQHLTAVRALAQITRARLTGDEIGSTCLTFSPQDISSGRYVFNVAATARSAGAVTLVAQTLLPVLLFAPAPSTIIVQGGTHVPWSPAAHYLAEVFLPTLAEMGLEADFALRRWGFYPEGGGEISLHLKPVRQLQARQWLTPPVEQAFQGLSAAANLPEHVRQRQSRTLLDSLTWPLAIREESPAAPGRGSFVFLWGPQAGFAALGAKGKPAERVAAEAVQGLQAFLTSRAAVDAHLADQIVLYASLATGETVFRTEALTSHLMTNIWVIEHFLKVKFDVQGSKDRPGTVSVQGVGSAGC